MTIEASDRLNYFLTKNYEKYVSGRTCQSHQQRSKVRGSYPATWSLRIWKGSSFFVVYNNYYLQSFTVSRSHCSWCCPVVNSIMPNIFMLNQLLLRRCEEKDFSIDLYKISGSLQFLSLLLSRRTPGQACRWSNRRKRKERRNRWRHQRRRLNHLHWTPHFSSIIIVHMTQGQSNTHLWGQFYLAIWDQ